MLLAWTYKTIRSNPNPNGIKLKKIAYQQIQRWQDNKFTLRYVYIRTLYICFFPIDVSPALICKKYFEYLSFINRKHMSNRYNLP